MDEILLLKKFDLTKVNINTLVLFLAFFPYSPNVLSFADLEPFALLACLIALFKQSKSLKIKYLDLIWIFTLSLSLFSSALIAESLTDFRNIFGGFSFIAFFVFGYSVLSSYSLVLLIKLVKIFRVLWILGVVLQFMDIPSEFMSPDRTTVGRGFTSFAPEATFAALQVISIATLLIIFSCGQLSSKPQFLKYNLLGYFFPILVHVSATAIATYFLGIFSRGVIYVLKNFNLALSVIIVCLLLYLGWEIVFQFDVTDALTRSARVFDSSSLRMINIWEYVITGRILEDASAFDRLSSSLFFLFSPYLLPQMINHTIWISDVNYFISTLNSQNTVNYSYRNLSGLGQLNVLTGLLVIIPLRGIIIACFRLPFSGKGFYILVPAFIGVLFFSTPLAHPLFGIVLGLAVSRYATQTTGLNSFG